ncbi:hypothetical protein SODALDRAFT_90578 [Sodiomyces alkalinus F11]|uniref:Tat pathway signal sequence n=1 Tax=Sodiomyces alkalinus (strain CBS 110278 / VKM F-3762 / F11) TaxID=1314773 RepID=A0A3N2Q0B1_SODAK|nr:hypothetical protein SODALDRAFT_90578 [Sodiomyces alkalinus F11]ROT40193.1 hypothetical protein SODALDRAFT_90578 [Sodiomyces alkalinus F11]
MLFGYHQTKEEESASDLLPSDEGCVGEIGRPPSRLHARASKVLHWGAGGLLFLWFAATFWAACLTLWPVRDGELLIAEDHSLNVPTFDYEIWEFSLTTDYTPNWDNLTTDAEADAEMDRLKAAWDRLMPVGRGVIYSTKNLDMLPPGRVHHDDGDRGVHSVAVYHELHCLFSIMTAFHNSIIGRQPHLEHIRHCFEYLRLALMCYGDTTLEGINDVTLNFQHDGGAAKAGSRHVCKNYDQVYDWAQQHRADNVAGIVHERR